MVCVGGPDRALRDCLKSLIMRRGGEGAGQKLSLGAGGGIPNRFDWPVLFTQP